MELQEAKKRYCDFKKISENCFGSLTSEITDYIEALEKENENLKCCGNCGFRDTEKKYKMHMKSNRICKKKEWKSDRLTQKDREI